MEPSSAPLDISCLLCCTFFPCASLQPQFTSLYNRHRRNRVEAALCRQAHCHRNGLQAVPVSELAVPAQPSVVASPGAAARGHAALSARIVAGSAHVSAIAGLPLLSNRLHANRRSSLASGRVQTRRRRPKRTRRSTRACTSAHGALRQVPTAAEPCMLLYAGESIQAQGWRAVRAQRR
jgi:hypothetical protein